VILLDPFTGSDGPSTIRVLDGKPFPTGDVVFGQERVLGRKFRGYRSRRGFAALPNVLLEVILVSNPGRL